jgi:hypothetical protein
LEARYPDEKADALDEVRLALARALLLVRERQALVRPAGEFDEVDARSLEPLRHLTALDLVETAFREVRAVDLDAQQKLLVRHGGLDRVKDLEHNPRPVVERVSAVLVGALVHARGQELREQVSVLVNMW